MPAEREISIKCCLMSNKTIKYVDHGGKNSSAVIELDVLMI